MTAALLAVTDLHKRHGALPVLQGVTLSIAPGEVLGLLGRSGAGKSTLARCIAALEQPDRGHLTLAGHRLAPKLKDRTRTDRQRVQYVWQEPMLALSPYRTALQAVMEPIEGFFPACHAAERTARAEAALRALGFDAAMARRRPEGRSGGQCQRVMLARALVTEPDLLLLDEPFSALDTVSTAALLRDLPAAWAARPCAVLLVAHDRAVVHRLAGRGCVLQGGRLHAV